MKNKETTRHQLNWQELIRESNLPSDVKSLVNRTVKRTHLWKREKFDVAEELISHFVEGIEKGEESSNLIECFGDTKNAAQLIRKGKKKNRHIVWHIVEKIRISVMAFLLVYSIVVITTVSQSPRPTKDYRALMRQGISDIPQGETGLSDYMKLFSNYDIQNHRYVSPEDKKWGDYENHFRANFQGVIKLIEEASSYRSSGLFGKHSYEYSPEEWKIFMRMSDEEFLDTYPDGNGPQKDPDRIYMTSDTLLPHASLFKSLSGILCASILINITDQEFSQIPNKIETIFKLSKHCESEKHMVMYWVSIANMNRAQEVVRRMILDPEYLPDSNVFRDILSIFDEFEFLGKVDPTFDKYVIMDVLQHCFTQESGGRGKITVQGIEHLKSYGEDKVIPTYYKFADEVVANVEPGIARRFVSGLRYALFPVVQLNIPNKASVSKTLDGMYELMTWSSGLPLWELNEVIKRWENGYQFREFNNLSNKSFEVSLGLTEHLGPKSALKPVMHRVHHENTKLLLALHGFYKEAGRWPEKLNDLVPTWLKEIPMDASTGKPLIYRIEAGKPLIYGRGYDGVDNGGDFSFPERKGFHWYVPPSETGDWLIWPVPIQEGHEAIRN